MATIEKETGVRIQWIPWEGRPEGVPFLERTPEEAERLLAKHLAIGARYGLNFIYPQKKCRTRLAHQATLFARARGLMDAYRDAVFEARFQEDLDISEPQVLVALGEKVGLDGEALEKALASETYAPELDDLRRQGESLGVTGIPTYILNGQTFWGVDPTNEVLDFFHDGAKGQG